MSALGCLRSTVLMTALTIFLVGCESETDTLRRTFATMVKQLDIDANMAASLYDEKRLLRPLAAKFGDANCQRILIKLDETPYFLRRDPTNMSVPYRAELRGVVTILPCGHKILYRDEFMAANEKHQWAPLLTGESIVSSIRTKIELDATNRTTIRLNPYESRP